MENTSAGSFLLYQIWGLPTQKGEAAKKFLRVKIIMFKWSTCLQGTFILMISLLGVSGTRASTAIHETGFLDREAEINGVTHRYQIFIPANYKPEIPHPVILFLHGAGEQGEDGHIQTQVGIGPAIRQDKDRFPFIVVFPQAHPNQPPSERATLSLLTLDLTLKEFNGDPDRIYLTGISKGGYATWYLAAQAPHKFAAIVPISGYVTLPRPVLTPTQQAAYLIYNPFAKSSDPFMAVASQISKIPVWIFHGGSDSVVWPEQSRKMYQVLKASGFEVKYTEYHGVYHDAWDRAYRDPDLWTWLLAHRRSGR